MTPMAPATLPPQLFLPSCSDDGSPHECTCGGACGKCGPIVKTGLPACPWWAWAIALGIVLLAFGDGAQEKAGRAPVRRKRR